LDIFYNLEEIRVICFFRGYKLPHFEINIPHFEINILHFEINILHFEINILHFEIKKMCFSPLFSMVGENANIRTTCLTNKQQQQ